MSEFKISRLRFSWAGEWVDQKAYNKDEIVQYNGKAYVCLIPHTSNGFYNDLNNIEPKWELMMTGQTWKGTWEPFTQYSLDNIVIFGGIVYKCNAQHVSASIIDPDIAKWDVYAESKTWQSEWTSNTTYGVGDIVQYGGSVYECIISHVSAATDLEGLEVDYNDQLDSTEVKWKLVKEGVQWRGVYATNSEDSSTLRYKINDIVKYGPSLYICTVGHAPSVEFFDYSTQTPLTETFNTDYWELWMPGLEFGNMWNSNTIYQPGEVVLYGGYLYQNKVINNINTVPSFNSADSTDAWELISQAFDVTGEWDNSTAYKVGSVVTYGGDLYVAITDSTNQVPGNSEVEAIYELDGSSGTTIKLDTGDSTDATLITVGMSVIGEGFARGQQVESVTTEGSITTVVLNEAPDGAISDGAVLTFVGTNAAYWELMIPGFNWEGRWSEGTLYNQDDIVYWGNATYVCSREHTATLVTRPDNDLSNSYWVVYLQHYQGNSLNNPGEMVVYSGGQNTALTIGGQSNVLKIINGLPTWSEIDFTPAVYYVATNGVDVPTNGTTPDTAWKTIRYACERVANGTLHPNAKTLLERNKEWIVEETFYWFLNQQNTLTSPFDSSYNFDNDKTRRDIRYAVDAVIYDLIRGGNSQTVANTLAYFDVEYKFAFTNDQVAEQRDYYVATQTQLFNNIVNALTNTIPAQSYQVLEGVTTPVSQYVNSGIVIESDVLSIVGALENIILTALVDGNTTSIPPTNQGLSSTIFVKSGTYAESLPIVLPPNTALNGDELRGVVVEPANPINTLCTRTFGDINQFVVGSTVNMEHNTPVQFVSLNPVGEISTIIGGITAGQTYYVIGDSITDTTFSVSETPDGAEVALQTNIGYMYVYGGEALGDMFRVQNGTGIRNMTLRGLLGTLSEQNEFQTRRPTGGAFVTLDPGAGPDDTSAWIIRKSPYMQNITNFGKGCVGMKVDSTLHNGGLTSMVCNDFTQIISDGIGIWCKGGDALVEAVSVFSYYNYAGYFSEDGGRVRATNGNSSYGTYGVVAEGFDVAEIPATGSVNNKSNEATAQAVSALGANAEILKVQYSHAGEEYTELTTNMLVQSNNFINSVAWPTDGNLTIVKASTTPYTGQDAWKVSATTSLTDSSYFSQSVDIAPQGGTYTNIAGENITGSGVGATFNVTVFSDVYVVSVNNGGSGYVVGNQIRISGQNFGAPPNVNDIIVTVDTLSITSILTISHTGIVPAGSALPYTFSIHAKKGTASYFDMYAFFTGYETATSFARFNFDTETASTIQLTDGGMAPSTITTDYLENGWWRISFTVWDTTAQNDNLEFRVYPRGTDGVAGYTNFYGAQVQVSDNATFFLETEDNRPSAYANINVQGAGSGVKVIGDELRSGAVFQTRLVEAENLRVGGLGYRLQTNNAQGGTVDYLTLAQSEVATPAEYEGMRISISSGKGAGQYGIISNYVEANKRAYVVKESFETLEITAADAATDRFTLNPDADFHTVYTGQKLQFTPTFYNILVNSASQNSVEVLGTLGDLNNYMYVTSTARLRIGQKINFTGETFGGVITGFDYYIIDVIDDRTIQISTTSGGAVWPLNNVNIEDPQGAPIVLTEEFAPFNLHYPSNTNYLVADTTSDMVVTYPIQFTSSSVGGVDLGTTYYIQDIVDATQFTISDSEITVTATATTSADDSITVSDTSVLKPLNPIIFKGTGIGGIVEKTRYYVNELISGTTFSISSDIITRSATASQAVTNLITVDSTAGFTVNSPIKFVGTTFGGITNGKVYYIQVINDATTFTISETPGGAAVTLSTGTGVVIVKTVLDTVTQTDDTGTLTGVSTGNTVTLEAGRGAMDGSFYTETFGGIVSGTNYFVLDRFEYQPTFGFSGNWQQSGLSNWSAETLTFVLEGTADADLISYLAGLTTGSTIQITDNVEGVSTLTLAGDWDVTPAAGATISVTVAETASPARLVLSEVVFTDEPFTKEMTITATSGGVTPVALTSDTGSMQIAEVGWDNINAGTPSVTTFDSTSVYTIEPRLKFTAPPFVQEAMTDINTATSEYVAIVSNGFYPIAIPEFGNEARSTSDFQNWDILHTLPVAADTVDNGGNGGWVDAAYGNGTWIIISRTGQILKSVSNGVTWLVSDLPDVLTTGEWSAITYGNGVFVAIARNDGFATYSTDNGATWTSVDLLVLTSATDFRDIAYGNEIFVAIDGSSDTVIYSNDNGATWTESTLYDGVDSTVNNWSHVEFGNGRFVAISYDARPAVYSFDGITWYASNVDVNGTALKYGQGVFVVLNTTTGVCCTSEDGFNWKVQNSAASEYNTLGFTFDAATNKGWFLTTSVGGNAYRISTGARAQARATVNSTIITSISMWEPGSGYATAPTLTITDPNNSEEAATQIRVGNGSLGAPSFVSYGSGYNTTSTSISITGSGYSDSYQTGLSIICKDVTRLPSPGDNIQFDGNDTIYRVALATILKGTTVPNLEVEIQLSPQLTEDTAPEDATPFTIRSRFSQVRLTNHDFLNIGYGNEIQSNYPNLPENTGLEPQNEVQETNNGRVFYSSTDQDGNFRVGDLFAVEQATGIVTLSADEFGLDGLSELSIGGVALGGSPVVITAFSTDGTFVANSNNLVPTQKAIRTYLTSRLSQGGSDTFTGLLTAGTVKVGGPDEITSTVEEGGEGWQVKIGTKAMVQGPTAAWAGDGLAMSYFMKTFVDPTRQ